jgi:hypothetical protein
MWYISLYQLCQAEIKERRYFLMTKKEFNTKFNELYKNSLLALADKDELKSRLKKFADESNTISTEELFSEAILLSIEVSKNFIHSILEEILEFSD